MVYENSFFQLVIKNDGTYLKLYPAMNGGKALDPREVSAYLDGENVGGYSINSISDAISSLEDSPKLIKLNNNKIYPSDEKMNFELASDRMAVVARFYPPSTDGALLDYDSIIRLLQQRGVKACYYEAGIRRFLHHREYCKTFVIARGKEPRHGEDASIEYHFNTDRKAKPALNEDGTVDFHQLDAINHVSKGDLLATLTKEDLGDPGQDIFGNKIPPRKVKKLVLKYGRNITETEDKTQIFSDIDGHVSLEGGKVFVSDTLEVKADVDASTGDIEYDGNVAVKGNVRGGFTVRANGDISVKGVVEGAKLYAGGQVVVERGVQGGNDGYIEAGGNVCSKFIENAVVKAGGGVITEAIMHSEVSAQGDIIVDGKKGLITGGKCASRSRIALKVGGSDMGTVTKLEVGADPEVVKQCHNLTKEMPDIQRDIDKNQQIVDMYSKKLERGDQLPKDKLVALKSAKLEVDRLQKQFEENVELLEQLQEEISANSNGVIEVESVLYPGVEVTIADVQMHIKTNTKYCKLVRDGADIRVKGR